MVAIFIGGHFGFGGMILGVPLFAVLYTVIKDFIEFLLKRKNLPHETSAYMPKPAITHSRVDGTHRSFKLTKTPAKKKNKKPDQTQSKPDQE
jgi:hypothetical protein